MKAIIEKQILEWKEQLAKYTKQKEQAESVLRDSNKAILMIEGGIQAKEMLLKKIESEPKASDTKASAQSKEVAS